MPCAVVGHAASGRGRSAMRRPASSERVFYPHHQYSIRCNGRSAVPPPGQLGTRTPTHHQYFISGNGRSAVPPPGLAL
ncbi:g5373 [Coccomyxa elongata]